MAPSAKRPAAAPSEEALAAAALLEKGEQDAKDRLESFVESFVGESDAEPEVETPKAKPKAKGKAKSKAKAKAKANYSTPLPHTSVSGTSVCSEIFIAPHFGEVCRLMP